MLYMQKRFSTDDNDKKHHKVRDDCHYAGDTQIQRCCS